MIPNAYKAEVKDYNFRTSLYPHPRGG